MTNGTKVSNLMINATSKNARKHRQQKGWGYEAAASPDFKGAPCIEF